MRPDASSPPVHGLSLRRYGASRGSHSHAHFQVLVGLDGVLELEVEGRGRRIAAGDGWVVTPGDRHDFESRTGSRCLVLDTAQALWAQCAGRSPLAPLSLSLARHLALCLEQPAPPQAALHHAPDLLLEAWGPAVPNARGRAIDWPGLADWARARWHLPLCVADLAAFACLSPSQFAQRCRDEQGMSAMHWLRGQRLLHARQLRQRGLSVAEAARRSGYRSPSALTAALRRLGARP
ncbi:AraC family transcriptional regulator [Variovorax saccharolyticus]|uniref:AraC family transcriptional regulator n=1 Tax=Variovorax saccharolyticus TaxID=3053516 RepID=UPI00257795E0|nr:AraC family transcriptional regulator [Variovorax sp. J31P216]MDM0026810.1 AraC family transcriptional regulator [Variovorax sp. J31P216]